MARAVAHVRPDQAAGLALICPVGAHAGPVPDHVVLASSVALPDGLGPELEAAYRSYFVVQTAQTLQRFREWVAPAMSSADEPGLSRIFSHWELRERPDSAKIYSRPVLVLAGRQDATAGHSGPGELAAQYPHATFAALDRAGHAVLHEQPELVQALITEWLTRVGGHPAA